MAMYERLGVAPSALVQWLEPKIRRHEIKVYNDFM